MDKELQDHVWRHCLPKEFKEEVKEIYTNAVVRHPCGYNHKTDLLKYLFGHHNLTSDEEEEEILSVPRKAIIQAYEKSCTKRATQYDVGYADCLYNLFGSKCLPDANEDNFVSKEPKPAEPKEDKHFDNILKDGFRNERRLNIAAQILSGIVASGKPCRQPVKRALELTDALVAECEKGGGYSPDSLINRKDDEN